MRRARTRSANQSSLGLTKVSEAHLEDLAAAAAPNALQLGVSCVAHHDRVLILPHPPPRRLLLLRLVLLPSVMLLRLLLLLSCRIYAVTSTLPMLMRCVLVAARRLVPPLPMLVRCRERCLLRFVPLGSIRLAWAVRRFVGPLAVCFE